MRDAINDFLWAHPGIALAIFALCALASMVVG